jgi:hypothetical protein
MRAGLRLQCFLLFLALPFRNSAGQEVNVRARVDSTNYFVGDVITVHLDATHPKGASLKIAVGDSLDGFSVLDRSQFTPGGETSSFASLSVAKYDSGAAVLPPLELLYSLPGDSTIHRASSNPLILTIHTFAVDTSQAYKDVKPPLSIPLTLAEIGLYLGIVVLVVAIAYFGYRYWKKKKQRVTGEVYLPPPRAAHTIALEELAILKDKRLWQQGLIKQYYSEVSEIARRYIENRFRLMALEETTGEIMYGLKRLHMKPTVCGKVETLLQLSDLVKFAKYQPGLSEHEEILSMAYDIVESTKLVEAKPAEPVVRKETVNVES